MSIEVGSKQLKKKEQKLIRKYPDETASKLVESYPYEKKSFSMLPTYILACLHPCPGDFHRPHHDI